MMFLKNQDDLISIKKAKSELEDQIEKQKLGRQNLINEIEKLGIQQKKDLLQIKKSHNQIK